MVDVPRFRPVDLGLLLLIVAIAAGSRAGYLVNYCDGGRTAGPLRVQDASPAVPGTHPDAGRGAPRPTELDQLIDGVKGGGWFGTHAPFAPGEEATAHISPGYPYLVGLLGRYVGDDQLDRMVRWGQVGLGAVTAALYSTSPAGRSAVGQSARSPGCWRRSILSGWSMSPMSTTARWRRWRWPVPVPGRAGG
ncbi:MAG: hypothetical protein U0736_01565 [Gemmataceae bacterium]